MRYSAISFVLFIAFFIGCNDKECDPVAPPIGNRVSFEISYLDYSDNNYFIDAVYTDTSADLNIYNLFYGNLTPIVRPKYFVKDFEIYMTTSNTIQNHIIACAYLDLSSRTSGQKYPDSLRNNRIPIPGTKEVGAFRLLHPGSDYIFNQATGHITFYVSVSDEDIIAAAYRIENESTLPTDDLFYGEFITDLVNNSDSVGVLKLIKPRNLQPIFEDAWKLKVKNQYQITPFIGQVTDLDLDIYLKRADGTESNLINNVRLLELFGLDKLKADGSPGPDGKFDYRPDITFRQQTSEIIFPVIEPFGNNIPSILSEYEYQAIYDTVKALLTLPDNRFIIKGKYKPL